MARLTKGFWSVTVAGLLLAGCGTTPPPPAADGGPRAVTPSKEPPSATGNPRSYVVFGKRYYVRGTSQGYRQRGLASWYGPKFHGRNTSSGTPFDMYAISAAHKSLPIPTYVRVTHLGNGRSLVVRVDDRGPFVEDRIIDLSYAAAQELDMVDDGTVPVEVVALAPYQFLPDFDPLRDGQRLADSDPRDLLDQVSAPATATTAAGAFQPRPSTPGLAAALPAPAESPAAFSSVRLEPAAYSAPPLTAAVPDNAGSPYSMPGVSGSWPATHTSVYLQAGAFSNRYNAERLRQRLAGLIEANVEIDTRTEHLYKVRIGPFHDPLRAERLKIRLADVGIAAHQVFFE